MEIGTNLIGSASLDPIKDSMRVNMFLKELVYQSKMQGLTKDVSALGTGLKSIFFPKMDTFEAGDKTCEVSNDTTALSLSTEELVFDKQAYISFTDTDCCKLETRVAYEAELIKRAAAAISRKVDDVIAAELLGAAKSFVSPITRDTVLDMIYYVKGNYGENIVMVVDLLQEKELLKIDEFSRNDIFGRPVNFTGQIGQLYGVPVISLVGMEARHGAKAAVFSTDAVAIGFQKKLGFASQPAINLGTDAMRYAWDNKFGVKALHIGDGDAAVGESAWISKLV